MKNLLLITLIFCSYNLVAQTDYDPTWHITASLGAGFSNQREFVPEATFGIYQGPEPFLWPSVSFRYYRALADKDNGPYTASITGLKVNMAILRSLQAQRAVLFIGEHYQTGFVSGFGFNAGGSWQYRIMELESSNWWAKIGIEYIGPTRAVFSLGLQTDF